MLRPMRLAALLGPLLAVAAAHAEPPPPTPPVADERMRAEGEYARGERLQAEGRYAEAIRAFDAAEVASPAPRNWLRIGECQEALGQLVSALEAYHRYLRSAGEPAESVRRHVAQVEAQSGDRTGRRMAEAGRWKEALAAFEQAEAAEPRPERWRDLGDCFAHLGELRRARDAWRRYLEERPVAPDAIEVRARIADYDKNRLGGAAPPAVEASPPDPLRREAPWFRRPAGWGMTGAALACVVAAATLGGLSSSARDEASGARTEAEFLVASDRADGEQAAAIVLGVATAVALSAAIALFLLRTPPPQRAVRVGTR